MIAPNSVYPSSQPETLVVFDFRINGTRVLMNDQRCAWGRKASVERLDRDHAVMVVRSGGARRFAR